MTNVFDYFEDLPTREGTPAPWAARAPRRPHRAYDLKLLPRTPDWQDDQESLAALEQVERDRFSLPTISIAHPRAGSVLRGRQTTVS
ncbi:MAG TPA: hypothetical protein VN892_18325, partial [Solirubrobacteraceae bacterium]|nr:hypothetical protein [Solirubrobacteraceae bacterium]